jgi:hypothetical protein
MQNDFPIFDWIMTDVLFSRVVSKKGGFIKDAWLILEMMSVSIFSEFCDAPEKFIGIVEAKDEHIIRPLNADEIQDINSISFSLMQHKVLEDWTLESMVKAPDFYQVLKSCINDENGYVFFLTREDKISQRLVVPFEDNWAIDLFEALPSYGVAGVSVASLSKEYEMPPEKMVSILSFLVNKGFVDRV